MLRCEIGDSGELQGFSFGERVADLDRPVVVDADDVARPGLLDVGPVLGHEDRRVGEDDLAADPVVKHLHPTGELPRADPEEGDPVAVGQIHVRLDLEDEAGERLLQRRDHPGRRRPRTGGGGHLHEGVEELPDPEIVDGAAEKDGGLVSFQVLLMRKGIGGPLDQGDLLPKPFRLAPQELVQLRIFEVGDS